MKRKLFFGIVVSGFFLWLATRGIDWSEFGRALSRAQYTWLVPAITLGMLGHFSRAVRWKYMMSPVKDCTIGPLWSATAIAFMVNNVLPARVGEFVRAYVIGRTEKVSKSAAFATIVYERVIDVFVLILLLWYCMMRISGPPWLQRSATLLVVFNLALFGLLVAMVRWRARFRALLDRGVKPLPAETRRRIHGSANAFVDGLGVVTRPSAGLPIALYSVSVWGCATLAIYLTLLACRLHLPAMASVVLVVLISLGSMIPSAPAFIGTMQYACVVGLGVYGVNREDALAMSAVYHVSQFVPITLAGFYYAWRSHLQLSELSGGKVT
jgi:uncharacterized protein (TIRG00374 family)